MLSGSQISLLVEGDAGQTAEQSSHDSREVCSGEIAILPPFLGSSQSLLNADHNKVYFQVLIFPSWNSYKALRVRRSPFVSAIVSKFTRKLSCEEVWHANLFTSRIEEEE